MERRVVARGAVCAAAIVAALTFAAPSLALASDGMAPTDDKALGVVVPLGAAEAEATASSPVPDLTDKADAPSGAPATVDLPADGHGGDSPQAADAPTASGAGEEPTSQSPATPADGEKSLSQDPAAASGTTGGALTAEPAGQAAALAQPAASSAKPADAPKPVAAPAAKAEVAEAATVTYSNMYRLYNPCSGEHFYTGSLDEARAVAGAGWRWEAVGWVAPDSGDPVYRLYNPYVGDHHYTLAAEERDALVALGWRYEGIGWYSDGSADSLAVLRQYNPNASAGAHNFTLSREEDAALRALGWIGEGEGWRASKRDRLRIDGFWLVTSAWGSLERYWVGADAEIARNRLVEPSEGSGWRAYATGSGAVVRGARDRGDGWAWYADNDGRLATGSGWVVTGAYDFGRLRRYWFSDRGGYALARVGWFDQDGATYYADPARGYVSCNECVWRTSGWYWADADGKVTRIDSGKIGWQNPAGFYQVSAYNVQLPSYAYGYFTYVTPSRIRPDASREACVEAFIQRATEYLGTPYRWNYAMAPGDGVDCVGLVMQCCYAVGMDLGEFNPFDHMATGDDGWHSHDANNLWDYGSAMHVGLGDRRRGDLISWVGHVAIYLGDDTIIEAAGPGTSVWVANMWDNGEPRGVIRLFQ